MRIDNNNSASKRTKKSVHPAGHGLSQFGSADVLIIASIDSWRCVQTYRTGLDPATVHIWATAAYIYGHLFIFSPSFPSSVHPSNWDVPISMYIHTHTCVFMSVLVRFLCEHDCLPCLPICGIVDKDKLIWEERQRKNASNMRICWRGEDENRKRSRPARLLSAHSLSQAGIGLAHKLTSEKGQRKNGARKMAPRGGQNITSIGSMRACGNWAVANRIDESVWREKSDFKVDP